MRLHFFPVMSFCLAALVLSGDAFSQEKADQTAPFIGGKNGNKREEKIFDALRRDAEIDFREIRMDDVLAELCTNHKIQFVLDESAADNNLDGNSIVTRMLKNVSLNSVLNILLAEFRCSYVVDRDAIMIVSDSFATDLYLSRHYDCRQLVAGMKGDPEKNFEKLVHVLKTVIDPKSWDSNGGNGGVAEIDGLLFVLQNSENHKRIEVALTTLLREPAVK